MRTQFPLRTDLFGAAGSGAYSLSRYTGSAGFNGESQTGTRETTQWRVGGAADGQVFEGVVNYQLAANFSRRIRELSGQDMYVERMAFALDGLGGPACNQTTGTPGVGGCQYYNPFSNAIQRSVINGAVNPNYRAAVANTPEMIEWLVGQQASKATNDLFVVDFVVNGRAPIELPGGDIGWAVGLQARSDAYTLELNDLTNVAVTPCQFSNPRSLPASVTNPNGLGNTTRLGDCTGRTGPLAFLSGTVEEDTDRTTYGFFGEIDLPVTDTFNVSASARYEKYEGGIGNTFDPKIALRWQATDWLAFRGSASTTFRAPPLSFLSGTNTALVFIVPANAFKAVDIIGNQNLQPEEAVATNIGVIFDVGPLFASLDYWRFDFKDPFQTESSGQIVTAYAARNCQDGGAGAATPECAALRAHVFPLGTTAGALTRVDTNIINGADILTSGLDGFVQYDFDVAGGVLAVGAQATYTFEYDSDDFTDINGFTLAPGGDFVGLLNDNAPFTPKPQIKGNVFARFEYGGHTVNYTVRYTDSYEDATPPLPQFSRVDRNVVNDVTYTGMFLNEQMRLSLSVLNIFDRDPPKTSTDLNYDPFTHNGFGQMIKVGVTYTLDPTTW